MYIVILIIAFFILIAGIYIFWKVREMFKEWDKETEQKQKKNKEKSRQEIYRKTYWNNLCNIYKGCSCSDLKKIYSLLQIMEQNKCRFDEFDKNKINTYWETCIKLKVLLKNPKWVYGSSGECKSDSPVYLDLDLNYVWNIINSKK
mgnify:CR=1 FL=1